jgi:hypothetical protein
MSVNMEELRAKIEAEITEKVRAEAKAEALKEFVSNAEKLVTIAQIAKEVGSIEQTVKGIITGANVQSVMKVGRSEFYHREEIVKAYASKHANLLKFLGIVHEAGAE